MNHITTALADDLALAGFKSQYDQNAKNVLANKQILSRILKRTVTEVTSLSLAEIEAAISNDIQIGTLFFIVPACFPHS